MAGYKIAKFVKVFSLESFLLYGSISLYLSSSLRCRQSPSFKQPITILRLHLSVCACVYDLPARGDQKPFNPH